jgi:hypothetical protein
MNASMTSRLPQKKVRLPELIPPQGAKPVGVHGPTGKIIYEMEVRDIAAGRAAKTQKIGPDGEPMYKKHATTGEIMYPIFDRPPVIFRTSRFILIGTQSQGVKMVENFEESREDIAERTQRDKVANFTEDLANEAVKRGFDSASEMMDQLFQNKEQPLEETAEEVAEPEQPLED